MSLDFLQAQAMRTMNNKLEQRRGFRHSFRDAARGVCRAEGREGANVAPRSAVWQADRRAELHQPFGEIPGLGRIDGGERIF